MEITIIHIKKRQPTLLYFVRLQVAFCLTLLTIAYVAPTFAATANSVAAQKELTLEEKLAKEFSELSESYYINLTKSASNRAPATSLKQLVETVENLEKSGNIAAAITALITNKSILVRQSGRKEINDIIDFLLRHNMLALAEECYQLIVMNADVYITSKTDYLFASYYFNHQNYVATIKYATSIALSEALNTTQKNYATLIYGASLQETLKHREAIPVLQKIPKNSSYYPFAQLNIAIANIRQGWWTDGHIAIKNILNMDNEGSSEVQPLDKEFKNRLYLVLAYSQFQNEFFRNARESFRHIELDSIYINRALLGLGLSALSQKDYSAALNAFSYLKESKLNDLTHAEAHIMLPYTYETMGELEQATLLYTESIAFFENKVLEISQKNINLKNLTQELLSAQCHEHNPSIGKILQETLNFAPVSDTALNTKITRFQNTLRESCVVYINDANNTMIEQLQSYQSQSQFALARLYDKQ